MGRIRFGLCRSLVLVAAAACSSNAGVCGDGVLNGAEECDAAEFDGAELDGLTCQDLRYLGGNLSCTASCTFELGACDADGDGISDEVEIAKASDPLDSYSWPEPLSLHQLYGYVVLLDVGGMWCAPCQAAAETSEEHWKKHRADGVVFVDALVQNVFGSQAPCPIWKTGSKLSTTATQSRAYRIPAQSAHSPKSLRPSRPSTSLTESCGW